MRASGAKWYRSPLINFHNQLKKRASAQKRGSPEIVVVGAGLAGAATAYAFAKRGYEVLVLEAASDPATAGSGNPQGMLYLKLSAFETAQSELLLSGFAYLRRLLTELSAEGKLIKGQDWEDCGVLQLAYNDGERKRQAKLAKKFSNDLLYKVTQAEASKLAGVELTSGGLFFPAAGWVAPKALTAAFLNHPNIVLKTGVKVEEIIPEKALKTLAEIDAFEALSPEERFRELGWTLRGREAGDAEAFSYRAKIVILANAERVIDFPQLSMLPIHKSRGQITAIKRSNPLKTVVSGEGYIAPSTSNGSSFGATFRVEAPDLEITEAEHQENIAMLFKNSPQLACKMGFQAQGEAPDIIFKSAAPLEGRAAYRANATGYLPVVGAIADHSLFRERFAQIKKDAKVIPPGAVPWLYGLYLNSGHGSRGMITTPISGEMLAAEILGESPFPVKPFVREALHPNRFYFSELRFNRPLKRGNE